MLKHRQGRLRILSRIDRLAHGNFGDVKSVGHDVSELRLAYGPGDRIYYTRRGDRVVLLLCGGDKSTQRGGITKARSLATEWLTMEDNHDE